MLGLFEILFPQNSLFRERIFPFIQVPPVRERNGQPTITPTGMCAGLIEI